MHKKLVQDFSGPQTKQSQQGKVMGQKPGAILRCTDNHIEGGGDMGL